MIVASQSEPGMIFSKRMNESKYFFETKINDCFQLNWIAYKSQFYYTTYNFYNEFWWVNV